MVIAKTPYGPVQYGKNPREMGDNTEADSALPKVPGRLLRRGRGKYALGKGTAL